MPTEKRVNAAKEKGEKQQGAFSRFFSAQKAKVTANEEVSNLLTHFAEDDLKRIAVMIQTWLDRDEKQKRQKTKLRQTNSGRGKSDRL